MSQADSMLSGVIRHLAVADKEIGEMNDAYVALDRKDRKAFMRPLHGADVHYSSAMRSTESFAISDVIMNVLDRGQETAGGNDATKTGIILKGEAVLNIGEAYEWTPRGHQDRYATWLSDESTIDGEEVTLPLYVVYAPQSDVGGLPIDRGQRNAVQNRSFVQNSQLFNAKARALHKELKELKGETVPFEIQGNVVYAVQTLPSGRQIAIAFVPFNQRTVGMGEETYTDRRGRTRKAKSGPMMQIANVGGVGTGSSKSA